VASLNGTGGYAERVVSPASRPIEIPDGVATRDAVALLADGRTALALAGRAGLRTGDTVLVEAAAGGVGTLLVQIARNAGARVVALAGRPGKLEVVRDLGADLAVDYSRAGWEKQVRDVAGEVDVVFDGVGGDVGLAAFGLLRAGGRFCPFGMASGSFAPVTPELARSRQVTVRPGAGASPDELAALVRTALAEAAAGRLRPVGGQEFSLSAAAAGHAAIEARATVGKTLLTVHLFGGCSILQPLRARERTGTSGGQVSETPRACRLSGWCCSSVGAAQGTELSSIHKAAIGRAVSRSPKESCCSPA
jgi:NADPH:quinone reductase